MTEVIQLQPPEDLDWTLPLPGSKSITNRALLFAALARGTSTLTGWLDADDTRHMRECLAKLGIEVEVQDGALVVIGAGGRFSALDAPDLFVGTAGTVARFLLPALAGSNVGTTMDGTPRMRERPMAMLIDGLRSMGAQLHCLGEEGFLPLRIDTTEGLQAGEVRLSRPASSQFVSGLAIAATLADGPVDIVLEQGTPARPYVDMTLRVLESFGGHGSWEGDTLHVEPRALQGLTYAIEPDASAASYPLTLAAIHGGKATIQLGTASMQGDACFPEVLERLGARVLQTETRTIVEGTGTLRGGAFDLTDMPDMTLTLAVAALHADAPTHIRGVEILRHHESDRLSVAASELRKLGADVEEHDDGLTIRPPTAGVRSGVEIDTYEDHRVAMAFSMAGHVGIRDPGCVGKTYPDYFNHLQQTGMVVARR